MTSTIAPPKCLKIKRPSVLTPAEAYKRSIENGISHIDFLIHEHANKGFVAFQLDKAYWINPEVIEHFKKLGYKYDADKYELSWADAGFNQ